MGETLSHNYFAAAFVVTIKYNYNRDLALETLNIFRNLSLLKIKICC